MNIQKLLTDHIDIWTAAETEKKSGRGRSSGNAGNVYGIKKLRELILELAVRGKLVPQDANDEPASELLKRIQAEKARLVAEGKIKSKSPLTPLLQRGGSKATAANSNLTSPPLVKGGPGGISENEMPFELPPRWAWIKVSEIAELITSGSRDWAQYLSDEGAKFITMGNLSRGSYELRLENMRYVNPLKTGEGARTKLEADDLLISITGDVGNLGRVPEDFGDAYINQHICLLRFLPLCRNRYFPEVMRSPMATLQFNEPQRGIKNSFRLGDLNEMVIPLPPINQQHRIVAKVDELMALCDQLETQHSNAADAHEKLVNHLLGTLTQSPTTASPLCKRGAGGDLDWQRIAEHFDTLFTTEASIDALKQTLLQLAVMGKLVPQDPNDEPASELLKCIQTEKAKLVAEGKIKKSKQLPPITDPEMPFDLQEGWEWIRVSDIAELTTSGSRDWAQYLSDEGAKFITMGNLSRGSYKLRLENMRYVNPPKTGEGSRTKLEANDLLISITGDVGNLGRIPENFGEAYINQHTCLLRFLPQCRNRYFPEAMRSPMASLQFNAPQRGIKNSFRLGDLDEMVFPLPPLAEQHRIVAKVDEFMALCNQLKSRIIEAKQLQQKLADVLVEQAVTQ